MDNYGPQTPKDSIASDFVRSFLVSAASMAGAMSGLVAGAMLVKKILKDVKFPETITPTPTED